MLLHEIRLVLEENARARICLCDVRFDCVLDSIVYETIKMIQKVDPKLDLHDVYMF